MKTKIAGIVLLTMIMSGCLIGDDTTSSITISDTNPKPESNGNIVLIQQDDLAHVQIREWHIDERNVTCWSFTEINYVAGIPSYGGFSCIPDNLMDNMSR